MLFKKEVLRREILALLNIENKERNCKKAEEAKVKEELRALRPFKRIYIQWVMGFLDCRASARQIWNTSELFYWSYFIDFYHVCEYLAGSANVCAPNETKICLIVLSFITFIIFKKRRL